MTLLAFVVVLAQISLVVYVARTAYVRYGLRVWQRPASYLFAVGVLMAGRRITAWLMLWHINLFGSWLPWLDHLLLPGTITVLSAIGLWSFAKQFDESAERFFAPEPPAQITIDEHSVVRIWDLMAERMFGYTAAEALDKALTKLIIPEYQHKAHLDGVRRHLVSGEPGRVIDRRLPVRAKHKNGSELSVEVEVTVRTDNGQTRFDAKVYRVMRV